jgi:hypothetical protein
MFSGAELVAGYGPSAALVEITVHLPVLKAVTVPVDETEQMIGVEVE